MACRCRTWPKPNTDTGGEFASATDRPELGQDGTRWVRETAVPDAPDEFATSVNIDTGGEFVRSDGSPGFPRLKRSHPTRFRPIDRPREFARLMGSDW